MTGEDHIAFNAFSIRLTKAYDPQGEDELHCSSLLIHTIWKLHRINSLENNTYALGHTENSNVIDAGHAEINAAFAAAITWKLNSIALDRLSLLEARLHRTMQKARAALNALQATRKAREAIEMAEAELLLQASQINGKAFDPAANGFVFTLSQITASLNRKNLLKQAYATVNGPTPSSNPGSNPGGNGRKPLTRAHAA